MRKIHLVLFILAITYSCGQKLENKANYPAHVGDIAFDERIDDTNFKVCHEERVFQYFEIGFRYKGEKAKINEYFKEGFKGKNSTDNSGYLTIRFIVNCAGKTGRFRIEGMDINYKEKVFDKGLVNQILALTKKMDGWETTEGGGIKRDYYQYLTFKLENGKLIEIMP